MTKVTVSPPGDIKHFFTPGDFILTHSKGLVGRLIRFGQALRFRGEDRPYAHWNHAALIVSIDGELVEAGGHGVVKAHVFEYDESEYHVVHVEADVHDRQQAVAFALAQVGVGYGWATIAGLIPSLLSGLWITVGVGRSMICSALVARSLERTDAIFGRPTLSTTPADLAKHYEVRP